MIVKLLEVGIMKDLTAGNEKDNSNEVFNKEDEAGDDIYLDYVSKLKLFVSQSTGSAKSADNTIDPKLANFTNGSKKHSKSFEETEELEWDLYEDMKQIVVEWTIDDTSISDAFFHFKNFSESKADRYELKFKDNPGEILALNSILLLEENSDRVQLDLSSAICTKIFEQIKAMYPKYDLPKVVEELCHWCAQVA
ncbi:2216_t:CDS:2 [Entrophospora sp. SA101]|nr:2216_t:CDS:2 [Entrophospora sp. SA101]